MTILFFQNLDSAAFMHVVVAGLAYWIIGAIWYMALFQKPWAAGMTKWGMNMSNKPSSGEMIKKMVISLLCNITGALFVAWLMYSHEGGSSSGMIGAKIGFASSIVAVAALSAGDNWLSKPLNAYLVDMSYNVVGLTTAGYILGAWH